MIRLGDRAEGEGMKPGRYNVGPRNGAGETMPYKMEMGTRGSQQTHLSSSDGVSPARANEDGPWQGQGISN